MKRPLTIMRLKHPKSTSVLALVVLALFAACAKEAPSSAPAAAPDGASAEIGDVVGIVDPLHEGRTKARTAFDAGHFDAALGELDRVISAAVATDSVEVGIIRCDRAAILANRAAASADLRVRERDLRLAIADCATEPALKRNLADTLVRRARDLESRLQQLALLRESLSLFETVVALVDLGIALEADDDLDGALVLLERAVELGIEQQREDPRIVALRDRVKKATLVEGSFKSAKHSHFVARFEGYTENQLAWTALDTLEQAWFTVGKALDLYPQTPTTVVIYTGAQYQQATAGPDWSTGLFNGKIRIREGQLAADRGTLQDTLVHEYVHAALHTLPMPVPTWFHEGLAQHFEQRRPPPARVLERTGFAPRTILDGPFIGLPAALVPAAYATSHALIERLVERRGTWGLIQVVAELKRGVAFDEAFVRSFAVDVDAVYAEVIAR